MNGVLLWGPALLVLSSCLNLAKSNPERQYYALDVTRQAGAGAPVAGTVLWKSSNLWCRLRFKGKSSSIGRTTHGTNPISTISGLCHPARCVAQQAQNWLINAQLFEHVVAASSYIDTTHRLEGTVTDLYGDYRQKDRRKAVVGIRMGVDESNPDPDGHSVSTRLSSNGGGDRHLLLMDLALAWNQGLEQVFTAFEEDLRKINLGANHQGPASRR